MLDFTDLVQIWLVGRASTPRLRLGVLAFLLVKFALELHSVILHRLQSSPSRPSWSSTRRSRVELQLGRDLHQVGEVQHLLPLDLMLVHFRPHLCSGYTDQYHSFLQKVKSSMITEQNGILIHLGTFVFHIIYFYQNSQRPPRTPSVHFLNFYYFKRCNSISVTYNYLVYGVK